MKTSTSTESLESPGLVNEADLRRAGALGRDAGHRFPFMGEGSSMQLLGLLAINDFGAVRT